MNEYHGGTRVAKGVYLNRANGELTQLYGQVRVLPGGGGERYIKVPGALAVMAGPFAGLAFVMFLPLIGIMGLIGFLAYKAWHGTVTVGRKVFQPVAIGQEPGMAYLTQRRGTAVNGEQHDKAAEPGIDKIADEVAQRREQGEK